MCGGGRGWGEVGGGPNMQWNLNIEIYNMYIEIQIFFIFMFSVYH